ncbi:hypothetical protein BH10ACT2_BH10ACT2_02480 [soil metagenome]
MSTAARFVARSQRRRQRGAQVLFVVAVGLIAAVTMSLVAGSRRSSSVIDRFFAAIPMYDAQIFSEDSAIDLAQLQALPGVGLAEPTPYMNFVPLGPGTGEESAGINSTTGDFTRPDPTARLLRGSIPADDERDMVVNEAFVQEFGLDVGDTVHVIGYANTPEQYDEISRGVYNPTGPSYDFTIAAVVRFMQQLATNETRQVAGAARANSESDNLMVVSNDFWLAHHTEFIDFGTSFDVRITDEAAGYQQFVAAIEALDPKALIRPWVPGVEPGVFRSSVALETGVLVGVGIGSAIAGLALILVLVRVQQRRFDNDRAAQIALGFTRSEQVSTAAWRTVPTAVVTTIVGTIGAIVLSARFPVGLGRQLELNPGVDVNVAVIAVGAVVTLLVPLAAAAVLATPRNTRAIAIDRIGRPPTWTRRLPMDVAFGVRFALGDPARGGRRANVLGIAVGVVAAAAALAATIWVTAADHLYETPAARGWMWDVAIGNTNFPLDAGAEQAVRSSPDTSALTTVTYGGANLDDHDIYLMGYDPDGTAPPSVIAGWLPTSDHEIALSATLMKQLDVGLGDSVTLLLDDWDYSDEIRDAQPTSFTLVGRSVSPELDGDFVQAAIITFDGFARAGVDAAPRILLADAKGPDTATAVVSLIEPLTQDTWADRIPTRVVGLHRVRTLPLVGAALAMLVVLATLVASTVATAYRNRYALAVLSALGLHRRRVRRIVAWQGVVTGIIIAAVACPLAVIAAGVWWRQVAAGLGIRADLAVPLWLLAATLATIVLAATITALTTLTGAGRKLSQMLTVKN